MIILFIIYFAVVRAEDGGPDDFSSNLFSDIAPLIALFGEQVAKQYLSQSLGWLENLIFACAPLGIITAVTCAIRVGGPTALRALIGRSQERNVQIELDILTSTSNDVCELWDGNQLVRLTGSPEILELVFDEDGIIYGRHEIMNALPQRSAYSWLKFAQLQKQEKADLDHASEEQRLTSDDGAAPNISLNGGSPGVAELRLIAIWAFILQSGILIFDAFSVYNKNLRGMIGKDTGRGLSAGFPLTFGGTLAVSIGVFICAYVVEARCRQIKWVPKEDKKNLRVVWLQRSQLLNDQHFGSCAIFADRNRHEIITSRANYKKHLTPWTCIGTVVTSAGFICQLIGLRTMHYPAAVAQFLATLMMTVIRTWTRRHSTRRPIVKRLPLPGSGTGASPGDPGPNPSNPDNTFGIVEIPEHHELDGIAKLVLGCKEWTVCPGHLLGKENFSDGASDSGYDDVALKVLENRKKLRILCGSTWPSETSVLAENVGLVIDDVVAHMWRSGESTSEELGEPKWRITISTTSDRSSLFNLEMLFTKSGNFWSVDRDYIETVLSMWLSELRSSGVADRGKNLWILSFADEEEAKLTESLLNMMNPEGAGLIVVANIAEICRNGGIDSARVLHGGAPDRSFQGRQTMALSTTSDLRAMCAQYLVLSFVSLVTVSTSNNPFLKVRDRVCVSDALFDKLATSLEKYSLATAEESFKIAFCALASAGKLPDPLFVLPQILAAARVKYDSSHSAVEGIFIELRMLLQRKMRLLKVRRYPDDLIDELGLGFMGEFIGVFGLDHPESQVSRMLLQEMGRSEQGLHTGRAKVIMENPGWLSAKATAEDVDIVRRWLVQDAHHAKYLNNYIRRLGKRACSLFKNRSYEDTELARLLILSGADCQFSADGEKSCWGDNWLELSATLGNVKFVKLLLEKRRKANIPATCLLTEVLCESVIANKEDVFELLLRSGYQIDVNLESQNRYPPLYYAAKYGYEGMVKRLIKLGANIESRALGAAAEAKHDSIGKFLIEAERKAASAPPDSGSDEYYNAWCETSLHVVAREGNLTLIRELLEQGWDINGGHRCDNTPLHVAIWNGHDHVAEFLMERGSRLEPKLLHIAADKARSSCARLLLLKGFDVNGLDENNETPLIRAVRNDNTDDSENIDTVKLLVERGARMDVKGKNGAPLLTQVGGGILKQLHTCKYLLEHGCPFDWKGKECRAMFLSAVEYQRVELIRLLAEHGLDVRSKDEDGETALHYAASRDREKSVRVLLEIAPGEWINTPAGPNESTALHEAVNNRSYKAVQVLLESGASVTVEDNPGPESPYSARTPLAAAVRLGYFDLVQLFMSNGATLDELVHGDIVKDAISQGEPHLVRALFTEGAGNPPASRLSRLTEWLPRVALDGRKDMVELLLEMGANCSDGAALQSAVQNAHSEIAEIIFRKYPKASLNHGDELLRNASAANLAKFVHLLLSSGVKVDSTSERGVTALHCAAGSGAAKALRVLLKHNSSPALVNKCHTASPMSTPLYAALSGCPIPEPPGYIEVVKMLIEKGASRGCSKKMDPDQPNMPNGSPSGYISALEMARMRGLPQIVKYLESLGNEE